MNDEMIDIIAGITGVLMFLLMDVYAATFFSWRGTLEEQRNPQQRKHQSTSSRLTAQQPPKKHGNGVLQEV